MCRFGLEGAVNTPLNRRAERHAQRRPRSSSSAALCPKINMGVNVTVAGGDARKNLLDVVRQGRCVLERLVMWALAVLCVRNEAAFLLGWIAHHKVATPCI